MAVEAETLAAHVRRVTIEASKRANVGHIGSCLSVADLVAALYAGVLRGEPGDPDRDRFVLSKGHAALALYGALNGLGRISDGELAEFCSEGAELSTHPEHTVAAVDFSTGSLGQGLSIGAGAALAARLQHSSRRVFVLVSDAECNEGALWEAIMFAAHHKLANLVAIVDANGQQALGKTRDVIDLEPLGRRFEAFGWDVHDVDGHDAAALVGTLNGFDTANGAPHVVVARTTFGKGVSYMEGELAWHYLPLSDAEYQRAVAELA
ncbi:MAG: transketolase [Actinobacteria bacterium]|nr:transketolase [Actinomycetota bacterium]